MKSSTRLRVALDGASVTRATEWRAEAPQLARITDMGGSGRPLTAHLLGGAAGPLGGDDIDLELSVEKGASMCVRSVAATLVQPGARGGRSTARVNAEVAIGAALDWWPEPIVAIAGCDHHLDSRLDVARGAQVCWVDELVAGRHDEPTGSLSVRQRVRLNGRAVADHTVRIGPDIAGAGWHGSVRCILTAVRINHLDDVSTVREPIAPIIEPTIRAACIAVEPGVTMWIVLGSEVEAVRSAAARLGLVR